MARTAVVAGTATAVSNRVSRRQANRWSQQGSGYVQDQPPPEAEPPPRDIAAQLTDLAHLKDQGVLTEQEFADQKARILAS
jgi:hypothetical protein